MATKSIKLEGEKIEVQEIAQEVEVDGERTEQTFKKVIIRPAQHVVTPEAIELDEPAVDRTIANIQASLDKYQAEMDYWVKIKESFSDESKVVAEEVVEE